MKSSFAIAILVYNDWLGSLLFLSQLQFLPQLLGHTAFPEVSNDLGVGPQASPFRWGMVIVPHPEPGSPDLQAGGAKSGLWYLNCNGIEVSGCTIWVYASKWDALSDLINLGYFLSKKGHLILRHIPNIVNVKFIYHREWISLLAPSETHKVVGTGNVVREASFQAVQQSWCSPRRYITMPIIHSCCNRNNNSISTIVKTSTRLK